MSERDQRLAEEELQANDLAVMAASYKNQLSTLQSKLDEVTRERDELRKSRQVDDKIVAAWNVEKLSLQSRITQLEKERNLLDILINGKETDFEKLINQRDTALADLAKIKSEREASLLGSTEQKLANDLAKCRKELEEKTLHAQRDNLSSQDSCRLDAACFRPAGIAVGIEG